MACFSVKVSFDGQRLEVQEDGYVGKLTLGMALIEAHVVPGSNIYGFTVDGKKNVVSKRNWAPPTKPQEQRKHYKLRVQIKKNGIGVCHTEFPGNHFRLLRVAPRGTVRILEIALISQDGDFFLTTQQTYNARCYRDGEKIVCPTFDRWPQMMEVLKGLLKDRVDKLKPIMEYRPEQEPTAADLAPNTARVLWFNLAWGIGAILTQEGMARVHWSGTARRPRLAVLFSGELVSYKLLREPHQTKLRSTSFRKEAVGVRPM